MPAPPAGETSFVAVPAGTPLGELPAPVCTAGTTPGDLTAFFRSGDPLIGADYQRPYPLPDGRVLWLFQDACLPTSGGPELVHNVGLLQSGRCFQLLRTGSAETPTPYLFAELTVLENVMIAFHQGSRETLLDAIVRGRRYFEEEARIPAD